MKQTKNEKGKAERRKGVMIDGREWVRRYDAAVSAQANMQALPFQTCFKRGGGSVFCTRAKRRKVRILPTI